MKAAHDAFAATGDTDEAILAHLAVVSRAQRLKDLHALAGSVAP